VGFINRGYFYYLIWCRLPIRHAVVANLLPYQDLVVVIVVRQSEEKRRGDYLYFQDEG